MKSFGTVTLAALAAAFLAAVCAHAGIDLLGDYLLRSDSYDHVAHDSRIFLIFAALALGVTIFLRLFSTLCDAARTVGVRVKIAHLSRIHALRARLAVTGIALALVPAMEMLDGWMAGRTVDSLTDAFGGSLLLGVSVTLLCAWIATAAAIAITRWIASHQDQIIRSLASLLGLERSASETASNLRVRRTRTCHSALPITNDCAKRGPPATSFVHP